jgi:hypothetical protein
VELAAFTEVFDRRVVEAFAPGWPARVGARLRARALDRALIAGADPASSRQLAARVGQLTARASRAEVADGLERLARALDTGRRWSVNPHRRAIAANADELAELADLLRAAAPVYARGLAMLRALLTDGTGPAYTDRVGMGLALALRDAHAAILG